MTPANRVKKAHDKDIASIKEHVENILDEQIYISQLSEGGISFSDTDKMDTYERIYILSKMIAIKKEENKMKEEAMKKAKEGAS